MKEGFDYPKILSQDNLEGYAEGAKIKEALGEARRLSDPLELPLEAAEGLKGSQSTDIEKTFLERYGIKVLVLASALTAAGAPIVKEAYETHRNEERAENIIGKELYKYIRAEGGTVSVDVFNEKAQHALVHLGQIHDSSNPSLNAQISDLVLYSQKKIASVLTYDFHNTKSSIIVCLEGHTVGESDFNTETIANELKGVSSAKDFQAIANRFIGKNMPKQNLASIRGVLFDWIVKHGFALQSKEPGYEEYVGGGQMIRIPSNYWLDKKSTMSVVDEQIFFRGAASITNPKLKITACEREETNDLPFKLEREVNDTLFQITRYLNTAGYASIDRRLGTTPESSIHNGKVVLEQRDTIIERYPDTIALYATYDSLSKKYQESLLIDREHVAVTLATNAINKSGEKFGYVVYGAAHDFSTAVNDYNLHVSKPYNLVSITFTPGIKTAK